jgi:hypothetical protein
MARSVRVQLDDDLDAAVKASGVSVTELVRRGLTVKARAKRAPAPRVTPGVPSPRPVIRARTRKHGC